MDKKEQGQFTYAEIMSQGKVWDETLQKVSSQIAAVDSWLAQPHDEVIFTGGGSTYYLSLTAAKHFTALTGKLSRGIPSSEAWYYPASTFATCPSLMVAVSRSGETTETVHAIEEYQKKFSRKPMVIGCYPDSTMAREATFTLLAPDAQEESIAQTRSFSSMFILSQILAARAARNQAYLDALNRLPEQFEKIVKDYEPLARNIADDMNLEHFVFLGSGLNFGLASEVMLKMKEMSTSVSEVFHFMEFRHGPMSMITDRSLVIGLMSDSRKQEENRVLHDMKKLGATTLALAENGDGVEADYIVELRSGIEERARGALFLPILQLVGFYHSLAKGLNPDQPTNLEAVIHL